MEKNRYDYVVKLSAVLLLLGGCYLVLRPFLTAILLAAVVCVTTWPAYLRLLHKMKGRANIAALIMTFSLSILVILPLALFAYNLADSVTSLTNEMKLTVELGPTGPPAWIKNIPIIGESFHSYWYLISTSQEDLNVLLKKLLEPARNFLLTGGIIIGQGVLEMSLAAFVSFFLYRDGISLLYFLNIGLDRVLGSNAPNVLNTIYHTVRSVMYGLLGTALVQGLVATIGFFIAGVPAAMLLGFITAILSLTPIGPPLVWAGASIWLFYNGSVGWGIFMLLWGFLLISSVDNVIKPLVISRGGNLPFILGFLGVMGGLLVFGFVGVFIGPTLLAVSYSLLKEWSLHYNAS